MTYPALTSHRQRHAVAFQFHLVRKYRRYINEQEKADTPDQWVSGYVRFMQRQRVKAEQNSMRRLLHLLFD